MIQPIKKRTRTSNKHIRTSFCILTLLAVAYSCKSTDPLTRPLFMQTKQANIELPSRSVADNTSGLLTETVTYRHQDNFSQALGKQDSVNQGKSGLNKMQYLNEVTVTAKIKQKFTPERNGKVNVDFVIHVPKELLSTHWQVCLYPKLLDNDSIVNLKQIVLKGSEFAAKQRSDSLAFVAYESSIVPSSAYDSLFLDHKAITGDLRKRQQYYYDFYDNQLKELTGYLRWKNQMEERCAAYNTRIEARRLELYHRYMRQRDEQRVRLWATGTDTTGISHKYIEKFNNYIRKHSRYHLYKKVSLSSVPPKYKNFFINDQKPENITNNSITGKDLEQISGHRYFFGRIAENETKNKRREELRRKMMPFPPQKGLYLDSIADGGQDFVFLYRQEYPVSAGLNRLRIIMDGKITATDRSGYTLPPSDTLYYRISSLVQLADTSLTVKQTKLYRNMYDRIEIYPQFEPGKSHFNPDFRNNRQLADTLINRYRRLTAEMGLQMDSIVILSHTSLDGSFDGNHALSAKYVESLKQYLHNSYSDLMDINTLKTVAKGEDWQGFVEELSKRNDIANKDSILSMIANTIYPDRTKQQIRQRYKKDYSIIRDSIYPKLNRMDVTFHLSRAGMSASDSIQYQTKEGYSQGLHLLGKRQYWKALEILKDYPDYNTALCLACMGYNGKAYDILVGLPETANNSYLLSIVAVRMDRQDQAVEYLLRAIELDPSKIYRIGLDPEVTGLVERYKLKSRIEQLADSVEYITVSLKEEVEG